MYSEYQAPPPPPPIQTLAQYRILTVGDVTKVDVYSQWRALYKSTWNSG